MALGHYFRAGPLVQWLKLSDWKVGYGGFEPHSGLQVSKKQNVFLQLTCKKIKYCGSIPWPRSSVLDLRPSGLGFRILCLEGSVIVFNSPTSVGGSLDSVLSICAQRWPKNPIRLFIGHHLGWRILFLLLFAWIRVYTEGQYGLLVRWHGCLMTLF